MDKNKKKISLKELLDEKNQEGANVINEYMNNGGVFQDMFGFTDEMMEARYAKAYDCYHRGDFKDALEGFTYLTMLNPYVKKYWMALGATQVRSSDYDAASVTYSVVAILDANDPTSHFFAAPCYLHMEQRDDAIKSLELAIEIAKKDHQYRDIENRANKLLVELTTGKVELTTGKKKY